ncbi:MAG: hypothetical protein WCO42_03540 [bacterium]
MKFGCAIEKMVACVVLVLALVAGNAMAQIRVNQEGRGATAAKSILRLRQLTGYGPRAVMKSPDSGNSQRAGTREWVELGVQYDTEPDWIDEVSLQYYALLRNRASPGDYILIKGVVTYLDVARGRTHQGVAYIRPAALERFGDIVGVAVEAVVKGEVVSALTEGRLSPQAPLPFEWWKNPRLAPKEGYILDKSKTPFALINFDEYEALK